MSPLHPKSLLVATLGVVVLGLTLGSARAAIIADSQAEFSGGQGDDYWWYGYYDLTGDVGNDDPAHHATKQADDFREFPTSGPFPRFDFTGSNWDWIGPDGVTAVNPPWTVLWGGGGHPNGTNNGNEQWAIRRWEVPESGDLQANLQMSVAHENGSTNARVYYNGVLQHLRTIPGGQPPIEESIGIRSVQVGDVIDFAIDPNGPDGYDSTTFTITIDDTIGTVLEGIPVADSIADFSGVQGRESWYYGYHNVTANGTYEAAPGGTDDFIAFLADYWTGSSWDWPAGNPPWDELGASAGHPNGTNQTEEHWVIRRWVSEVDGGIEIEWNLAKTNLGCGNGVTGLVLRNGQQIDSATIALDDATGVSRTVRLGVHAGDFVDVVLSADGTFEHPSGGFANDSCDGSSFSASIRAGYPITLTWDALGDGNWDAVDGDTGSSRWVDAQGGPSATYPDDDFTDVVVTADTVTVAADRRAKSLTVESGSVVIADDATLDLQDFTEFAEGTTLTLGAGARLNVGSDEGVLDSIVAADGATLGGEVLVAGTTAFSDSAATLITDGEFEFDDDAAYAVQLAGAAGNLLDASGDVWLGGTLSLQATARLDAVGDATRTIISVSEEGTVGSTFATTPAPDDHLGFGVFLQGLTGGDDAVDVSLLQAMAGDTDGNREIDNADLQLILAANSFNQGPGFDWTQGDFDGDTNVDNIDLQLVLATGEFGAGPYTAVAPTTLDAAVAVVPEPTALVLLAVGGLGLLAWRCRRLYGR